MPSRRPTRDRAQRPPRTAVARVRPGSRQGGPDGEGGFILLETVIALTLITTVMAAVGMQYVSSVAASSYQRSAATAAQLASSRMSELRAMNPTDLLRGRTLTAVTGQRDRMDDVAKVSRWVSPGGNRLAFDNDATKQNVVPTTSTSRTIGSRTYAVDAFLECREDVTTVTTAGVSRRDCLTATDSTKTNSLRAVVAVTWKGTRCANSTCALVTSSVIDPHSNPTFELNQELPAAPVIDPVPTQTVVVGDTYSRQLTVKDDTGAAPFQWSLVSGSLPQGLSLSPAGLISPVTAGTTVGEPTGTRSSTVRVTDSFLRQKDLTISWSVQPRLAIATVANKTGFVNQAASTFTLTASGGTGGYVFADTGNTLPPGVGVSPSGSVSGTTTTAGTYSVVLKVTDNGGRTATVAFTWTVTYPPIAVTNPGAQTSTIGFDDGVDLDASGGSGSYRWTSTALPAGLTLNADTGVISGRPTGPATGTGSPLSVTATATDRTTGAQQSVTFTWRVYAAPTVTTPQAQTSTDGNTVALDVSYTCPSDGCTFSIENQPNGLSITSAGRITGTVANNAVSSSQVRVRITDATGATVATNTFTWTVHDRPTWSTIPNQTSRNSSSVSVPMAGYVTQNNVPYVYSASGLPTGLSINASTGVISGTTAAASSRVTNAVVTVRDQSGVIVSSTAFSWNVSNLSFAIGNSSVSRSQTYNVPLSNYTSGGTTPYTYTSSTLPAGLTISGGTNLSGRPTAASGPYTVSITARDNVGATVTTTFTLTVTS